MDNDHVVLVCPGGTRLIRAAYVEWRVAEGRDVMAEDIACVSVVEVIRGWRVAGLSGELREGGAGWGSEGYLAYASATVGYSREERVRALSEIESCRRRSMSGITRS
jgi:hypothetical protein